MRPLFRMLFPAALVLASVHAQSPDPKTQEWDVRAVLKEISAHAGRLVPLLEQVDPAAWTDKSAAESYSGQWKSARAQAQALSGDAVALAKDPEKLSEAMKVFFRMQALEFMIQSLGTGVRRYQNPAVADLLTSVAAENGANRERFQKHIVDLVALREQEYAIMDYEAQRCRAAISREVPGARTTRKAP